VTLRRDWKSCGFFRHSSVRERLRSGAWLRLGASRSAHELRNEAAKELILI